MTFTDYLNEAKITQDQFEKWVNKTTFKTINPTQNSGSHKFEIRETTTIGDYTEYFIRIEGTGSSPATKGNMDYCDVVQFADEAKKKFMLKFHPQDYDKFKKGSQGTNCMNNGGFRIRIRKDSFK